MCVLDSQLHLYGEQGMVLSYMCSYKCDTRLGLLFSVYALDQSYFPGALISVCFCKAVLDQVCIHGGEPRRKRGNA